MIDENINYYIPIFLLVSVSIVILWSLRKQSHKRHAEEQQVLDALAVAGYAYDSRQDIFWSRMDAWQKSFGYSRIYDEAAAPMGMIIDCEPVRFLYGGKKWLIELWKGQYGMTTGAEIGVYTTMETDAVNFPDPDKVFYDCADREDQLYMAFILRKNGRAIFSREGRHWWLTGFALGEFSHPEELQMEVSITLKDREMCRAFVNALIELGYASHNMKVLYTTVWLSFFMPYSSQPLTRTPVTDALIQKNNQTLCHRFRQLTEGYSNSLDKLTSLFEKAPDLYDLVFDMGKPHKLFKK